MDKKKIVNILDRLIEFAFYVLIAAVTFSTAFVEISITAIFIAYLLKKIINRNFSFPKYPFIPVLGLFILVNLLSFINSDYFYGSFRGIIKIIKYALLFIITMDSFKTKAAVKKAIYVILAWSLVVVANGVIQNILGFDLIRLRTIDMLDRLYRISSSFRHPNNFGAYLIVVIPLYLAIALCKKASHKVRMFSILALAPMVFCLVRTYSRGAWVALFFAVLVWSLLRNKRVFIILILIAVLLPFFMPPQIKARFFDMFDFGLGTTTWERVKLWEGAIAMIKVHPFLGFGVNTYTKNFPDYKPPDYPDSIYPHNSYLHMAAEIGLIGLALFLIFIILVFIHLYRCFRRVRRDDLICSAAIGLFSGLVAFLIQSAADTHLYSINLAVMFYFLLGFCIVLCNYVRDNPA